MAPYNVVLNHPGGVLIPSTVGATVAADLADNAVTNPKIADNAVDSAEIADNAVTNAKLADNAVDSAEIAANAVGAAEIADAILTGAKAAVVANANVIGGILVLHRIDLAAGPIGDTDLILTHKTRIIDCWLVLRGTGVASCVVTLKNGANGISSNIAASGADTALLRTTVINDANYEIAAGGTLRATSAVGASQPECTVYVVGIRVA